MVRFFDKYYAALQLSPGASDTEVKAAYRKLAKKYHPDKSGTEGTRHDFIRVNEAYVILMKREAMVQEALQRNRAKQGAGRGSDRASRNARERASTHADMKYEEFVKSPLYRTAMVMDSAFDYVFLLVGVMMVTAPIIGYISDTMNADPTKEEPEFHVFPIVLGIGFLYGLWFFLFKSKRVKQ